MSIEICRIILQSDYNYQQKKESCRVSGQFVHCPAFASGQKSAMTAIMTTAKISAEVDNLSTHFYPLPQ